mmetsp:Transcript_6128/g.14643  ORF Transcript_6128/g.14643 Transcript_6128/m.14643 type:complete len:80 (+) Transcript_6128:577-816(+)
MVWKHRETQTMGAATTCHRVQVPSFCQSWVKLQRRQKALRHKASAKLHEPCDQLQENWILTVHRLYEGGLFLCIACSNQ